MKPRVCICCGESMAEGANALSRNPNLCASCSSLADGMAEDANLTSGYAPLPAEQPVEEEVMTEGRRGSPALSR